MSLLRQRVAGAQAASGFGIGIKRQHHRLNRHDSFALLEHAGVEPAARGDAKTPEGALRNILSLVDGSDEMEDVRALQILLQSVKTLAEKGLGRAK
jgi:hypothetical protein